MKSLGTLVALSALALSQNEVNSPGFNRNRNESKSARNHRLDRKAKNKARRKAQRNNRGR